MTDFIRKTKELLFSKLPEGFLDPILRLPPSNERELSVLLALLHNEDSISWNQVPVFDLENEKKPFNADFIFSSEIKFLTEYPMFSKEQSQIDIWGAMSGDLIGISKKRNKVIFIENKIGGNFTSCGADPEYGQLSRQIKYLISSRIEEKIFVIVSSKMYFDNDWYRSELRRTIDIKFSKIGINFILLNWEDIFKAVS